MKPTSPAVKLEKLLYHRLRLGRREARRVVAEGRVRVDGETALDPLLRIDEFARVEYEDHPLQGKQRRFLMVHKPAGHVSSVGHHQHPTVIDLLPETLRADMHYAGRLDLSTTGLMIVTNDGKWSRRLTEPELAVPKVYQVTAARDLEPDLVGRFAAGMYFAYENITTLPAELEILGPRNARLTLHEGKYHQVKRMFHAVGNRVIALHRERVGRIVLDVAEGGWRELTPAEVDWVR